MQTIEYSPGGRFNRAGVKIRNTRPVAFEYQGKAIKVNAKFFDPNPVKEQLDPVTNELIPARSLLDFVVDRFIRELLVYYLKLFHSVGNDNDYEAIRVPEDSLKKIISIVEVNPDTAFGVAIANLLCDVTLEDGPHYAELITDSKNDFIHSHKTYFCGHAKDNFRGFDVTKILTTDDTLSDVSMMGTLGEINAEVTRELLKLEGLTIEQNDLINDVKKLSGKQVYDNKIRNLQMALQQAEGHAKDNGLFALISNVVSVVSAFSDMCMSEVTHTKEYEEKEYVKVLKSLIDNRMKQRNVYLAVHASANNAAIKHILACQAFASEFDRSAEMHILD